MQDQGPSHRCIRDKLSRMMRHVRGGGVRWTSLFGSLRSLHSHLILLMPAIVSIYMTKYCDKNILIIHRSIWKSKVSYELITNVFSMPNGDSKMFNWLRAAGSRLVRWWKCSRLAGTNGVGVTEELVMIVVDDVCDDSVFDLDADETG